MHNDDQDETVVANSRRIVSLKEGGKEGRKGSSSLCPVLVGALSFCSRRSLKILKPRIEVFESAERW